MNRNSNQITPKPFSGIYVVLKMLSYNLQRCDKFGNRRAQIFFVTVPH